MRIKELADLTGSTVRTIRYYHQIGLLPVPAHRYGSRDYDMVHVARLVRVRWLAQAGIPLAAIAAMLGDRTPAALDADEAGRESVLADLRGTVQALDQQLAELQAQRDRIGRLIATVEHDGHLSPMPAAMVRVYDELEARATDDAVRRVIRRERGFMELAYYRGDMPPEAAVVYERLTDARLTESIAAFGEIAERTMPGTPVNDGERDRIAGAVLARLERQLGPDLPNLLRSIDLDVARRAADLYVRLAAPEQRPLDRAIADALIGAIEKEHHR